MVTELVDPLSADLRRAVLAATAWLDQANGYSTEETTLRLLKVGEEYGEVAAAWIGARGQNPRKGKTHSVEDVAAELADVVFAALVATASLGRDPGAALAAAVTKVSSRLPAAGNDVVSSYLAAFDTKCSFCSGAIRPGDTVAVSVSGAGICPDCPLF